MIGGGKRSLNIDEAVLDDCSCSLVPRGGAQGSKYLSYGQVRYVPWSSHEVMHLSLRPHVPIIQPRDWQVLVVIARLGSGEPPTSNHRPLGPGPLGIERAKRVCIEP